GPGPASSLPAPGGTSRDAAMVRPHSGVGGGGPRPRKPSAAAVRIVKPIPIEARTMIGEAIFGKTWSAISRHGEAPRAAVHSTKTSFCSARVSAYTTRANHGQYVTDSARMTFGSDGPR